MPYIQKGDRAVIDSFVDDLSRVIDTDGELNYTITRLLLLSLKRSGTSYSNLNSLMGVLECAKQEFYRRHVVPYEEVKILENGDVDVD